MSDHPESSATPRPPRIAHIVSHTHWDREWYLTFHEFRVHLARVIRQVLDALEQDAAFPYFVLDGQTILLEDYLAVCPEDAGRLRALVQQGALVVGPWYILPDEFLVSGEATVRNLLLGHQVADAFGPVQKVGYMPDSFGHIAQLPQILRQAGIDSFIYTRGNGDEIEELGHEFIWQAPDGSEVLAINQCGGYCNAAGLGLAEIWHAHTQRLVDPERAVAQVRELFVKMAELARGDIYLLNNGCDHFPPQRDFAAVLAALRDAFPATEFKQTDFADFIDTVRTADFARERFAGEMIQGRLHHILSGVWSTRIYLKQQNHACQTLLSNYVEPLAAYSHFRLGETYPAGLIDQTWKLLLQNHPHDSICGCSTDAVHRDMESRFAGVLQTGEELLRRHLQRPAPTFARQAADDHQTVICVANPLPAVRTAVVDRLVVLQPPGLDRERLQLLDENGRAVPFVILDEQQVERFWAVDYRTELFCNRQRAKFENYVKHFGARILRPAGTAPATALTGETTTHDQYLLLQFLAADLPALGHVNFRLTGDDEVETRPVATSSATPAVIVTDDTLDNEYYRVRLHGNGTFSVLDKSTGKTYGRLNRLVDTEDIGDEYDYSPAPETMTISASRAAGTVRIAEETGFRGTLEAEFSWRLPTSVTADRRRRAPERLPCRVVTQVSLEQGSRLIQITTLFDNLVQDHRLRAEFPTAIETDTVLSDGHFYINRRPVRQPRGAGWVQPPTGTYPQQEFTLVQDGERGLALLNQGLPEIAADHDNGGRVVLSLTLLRAVEWLSRDDFGTRQRSNAGPTLHTPDAQCLGTQAFQYAVVPFAGDFIDAGIKQLSDSYRVPVIAVQGVEDGAERGGVSFLRQATTSTSVSAIKRHRSRATLLVRLFNLRSEPVTETLTCGQVITSAWRTDLLEERQGKAGLVDRHEVTITLEPHEIVSLEIEFGN